MALYDPLTEHTTRRIVAGYPPHSNNFSFINSLSYKVFGLIKQYASGKP